MGNNSTHRFVDLFGNEVILTAEVKRVIFAKHPEVSRVFDKVADTLALPDAVKRSSTDVRVRLYYRFYQDVFDGKFIVIVVKRVDYRGFVSTIYITDKMKAGEMIWQK